MIDLDAYWRTSPPTNESMVLLLATKGVQVSREPSELPTAKLETEADARSLADALNSLGVAGGG